MKPHPEPPGGNRRDFIRHSALGGMAALTGALAVRSVRQTCHNDGLCRGCAVFDDCGLPQALSAKQAALQQPPR